MIMLMQTMIVIMITTNNDDNNNHNEDNNRNDNDSSVRESARPRRGAARLCPQSGTPPEKNVTRRAVTTMSQRAVSRGV